MPAERGEKKAKRQCWECLKRRLVCDHTLPHCKKCQKLGKDCPGYDEQKPLQWIQTGRVTSKRKNDSPAKVYRVTPRENPKCNLPEPERLGVPADTLRGDSNIESVRKQWKSTAEEKLGYLAEDYHEEVSREMTFMDAFCDGSIDAIFAIGGRSELERVVQNGLHEEAAQMMRSEPQPMKRLERILRFIIASDVPDYSYLRNDTNEVVQAVNYCMLPSYLGSAHANQTSNVPDNMRIHPLAKASGELVPNPVMIRFPLAALHVLPPAVHHTLVCLSLNHFIHTLPVGTDKNVAVTTRSKIYQHRGAAIRSLSQYVGKDKTRSSDLVISSILVFLAMELQNPPIADWRSHASGLRQLIELRGGLKSLMKQSPHLVPTLSIFILIVTMANTCSPSWDQLDLSGTREQHLKDIESIYKILFPYTLCPPTLYLAIIRINHLRARASESLFSGEMDASHLLEAHDLLTSIEAFRPEDWAQPGDHHDDWLLIGSIYQSSAALYCTMAFQALAIFPSALDMDSMRSVHGDHLLSNLRQALKIPRLSSFVMWPLTVAGVEAGYRDAATRHWIGSRLTDLARLLGTGGPLKSQAVLRRYWKKEERGWDECFDRPYVFIM